MNLLQLLFHTTFHTKDDDGSPYEILESVTTYLYSEKRSEIFKIFREIFLAGKRAVDKLSPPSQFPHRRNRANNVSI